MCHISNNVFYEFPFFMLLLLFRACFLCCTIFIVYSMANSNNIIVALEKNTKKYKHIGLFIHFLFNVCYLNHCVCSCPQQPETFLFITNISIVFSSFDDVVSYVFLYFLFLFYLCLITLSNITAAELFFLFCITICSLFF